MDPIELALSIDKLYIFANVCPFVIYGPVVELDFGQLDPRFLEDQPTKLFQMGQYERVPLMTGTVYGELADVVTRKSHIVLRRHLSLPSFLLLQRSSRPRPIFNCWITISPNWLRFASSTNLAQTNHEWFRGHFGMHICRGQFNTMTRHVLVCVRWISRNSYILTRAIRQ